jgi:glycosyltransferase involved in cell wall biosynthesis
MTIFHHTPEKPLRILHAVRRMYRGGIETWLMHMLRHVDRTQFQMDFLVHDDLSGSYDEEVRDLGGKLLLCETPSQPLKYAQNFSKIIREYGPYDIVHSHVHNYSGYILQLARRAGIPGRIAHSHNDRSAVDAQAGMMRQGYLALMKHLIREHATVGLACSQKAAVSLFGPKWHTDARWQILYYGIDLSLFHPSTDGQQMRQELHIPPDAFVMGHVGRFAEQKNHAFLIDIMAEVARRDRSAHLLLIGDGPLEQSIAEKVAQLGLSERVTFAGSRPDVPQLMMGVMDMFVMPSFHEGLPMVGIEAQAAGLPLVLSDTITEELDQHQDTICRMSLSQPPAAWADAILALKSAPEVASIDQAQARSAIEQSEFNIVSSKQKLEHIYSNSVVHA